MHARAIHKDATQYSKLRMGIGMKEWKIVLMKRKSLRNEMLLWLPQYVIAK